MLTIEKAKRALESNGHGHVLAFWPRLDEPGRTRLLAQIEDLDFDVIGKMRALLASGAAAPVHHEIEPAEVLRKADMAALRGQAVEAGEAALRAGRVGVILVAGGQGTRLGYDGPKGTYALGPVSGASLFEIHARKILALRRRYGASVPWYIMTSDTNDAATREFFDQHACFGLPPGDVRFFQQGMLPALDAAGRIVLDRPDHIFVGPDGHGGTLTALEKTGQLRDMARRGLSTLFYFQVDNALVEIAEPHFIGRHIMNGCDMSLKVCAKRDPSEGLGMVVRRDGRLAVVEYTELTHEQKHARTPSGELRLLFGSVAIHVFSREFLERESAAGLPFHLAHKKVPCCDAHGNPVAPEKPNAYKFEKFIFDALPDARQALVVEFAREDEFSPLKNATGDDSADTARRDIVLKFARWLEAAGRRVPCDAAGIPRHRLEIDPCFALDAGELRAKIPPSFRIEADTLLKD